MAPPLLGEQLVALLSDYFALPTPADPALCGPLRLAVAFAVVGLILGVGYAWRRRGGSR